MCKALYAPAASDGCAVAAPVVGTASRGGCRRLPNDDLMSQYRLMISRFRLPGDELESAVLAVIWELGAASVREVYDRIGEPKGLVYTTIAKVMDRLREKGLVRRSRHGKAFLYRPRVGSDDVERERARAAVSRLLGSAPHAAVAALVEAVDSADPGLLDELERAVAAHRRSKNGA